MPTIAYISSILPARSETFVYREIRELRRRGWDVVCVSLNQPAESIAGLEDLERGREIVYSGWGGITGDLVMERMEHFVKTSKLDLVAQRDAFFPGETTGLSTRFKVFGQRSVAQSLAYRLRMRRVQHIHCHFAHAPTTVGMYAAMQLGVPFSFTGHANDLFQRRALLKRKLQRAAFINCISEWHREFYIGIEPSCAAKCHVVRCGVDVDSWKFDPGLKPPACLPIKILSVCRLVEKKGVDNLLRGLGQFARGGGLFELTVAGDGPQRGALENIAREEKIQQHVKFLGAVDNDRVRELLQQSDAFALTCRDDSSGDRDGIPVVLMEAMACGLPVISGDLPAIRELVSHDQSGLMVDGTDVTAIAQAVARIANDSALRRQLGDAGRRRVVEEFSLFENVSRIEKLLRQTMSIGPA
jgi:glycosyltransferase involved in cell wall biosynthesis